MSDEAEALVRIPPGTVVLDKYRVVRTLGVGGMGMVVLAKHEALGREVAIKFLLPQFAVLPDASRRFVREAQAASRIASEHIVRVFDTGSSSAYGPYIVMEYLEGTDLARHVRARGAFSIEIAIDYTVQAALALGEAHLAGIVHRDVKPANLFVVERSDGSHCIKVLDFGISKVAEESSSLEVTKTSAILGSGLYMSPEQMKSAKKVDERTDVYALGVSLFEMLARTQPFTAESFPDLVIKVNMEAPTDLRSLRPDVPPELAAAIARAYARKPADRYQTMAELAAALGPWAAPATRPLIEKLARLDAKRRGSAPSIPPDDAPPRHLPPLAYDGELRLPRPAAVPSPSSVGIDTFGLSKQKRGSSVDPLGQTAAKSFSANRSGPTAGLLGAGVAVGVVASLAAAGFYYLRARDTGASAPLAVETSAESLAATPPVVTPSGVVPTTAPTGATSPAVSAAAPPSAPTASAKPPAAKSAAQATANAPGSAATTAPTVAPKATGEPCYIRDLDGTTKPCP